MHSNYLIALYKTEFIEISTSYCCQLWRPYLIKDIWTM